jgi:ATP synthase protein I
VTGSRPPSHDVSAPASEAEAFHVLSLLISGVLLWGGVGWALAAWLHAPWLAGIGVVVGGVLGVSAVLVRYGRSPSGPALRVGPDLTRPTSVPQTRPAGKDLS